MISPPRRRYSTLLLPINQATQTQWLSDALYLFGFFAHGFIKKPAWSLNLKSARKRHQSCQAGWVDLMRTNLK